MKKNSIVIAMFLVVALTVSAFAASFADVPANHWAYEAVNKLVAAGLISGYPDGTYRGQNTMTRYEVATILARLLNSLAEMREEMMDQVTFMIHDAVLSVESGLSEAQAEDVQAILQAVIDKNTGGAAEGLTTAQAEEIYNTIADLAREFDAELLELGIRVGRLERRVAALEEATPEKPAVSFGGEYKFGFKDNSGDVENPVNGGYYNNPFNYNPDNDPDYTTGNEMYHQLDLNVKVENGPLTADLDLEVSKHNFLDESNKSGLGKLESISGTITGNDFTATIKRDQERGLKPYLFDGYRDGDDWKNNKVQGVVVDTANGTYFIHSDVVRNEDGDKVEDAKKYAIAGSNEIDFLGGFNVVYGFEKDYGKLIEVENSTNVLFGVNKTFNLGDFDVTPEFAMNKGSEEEGHYFTLNAKGKLAVIDTTFNYKNIEAGFTSIVGRDNKEEKGFDVKGETSVGIVDVVGYYEDYDNTLTYFTGEVKEENAVNLLGFNFFADGGYRSYTNLEDATSKFFNMNAKNSFGKLDVHGKLEWQDTTQLFDDTAGDDFEEFADGRFDKILDLDYNFSDALKAGAFYKLDKNNDLAEHVYNVDYAKGIVTAGAEFKLQDNDKENHFYAGLNADKADSYDLLSVAFTPYVEFKTWTQAERTNIIAGVDARKALTEYADLVAGYEYYDSQKDLTDDDHDYYGHGTLKTTKLGVEYRITDDVTATANYKHLDFVANSELNTKDNLNAGDFKADLISAGITIAF